MSHYDHQTAIIIDEKVMATHRRRLEGLLKKNTVISFRATESNKSRRAKERLEEALFKKGFGRDCLLVAIGGGVTLDLAGFVAATYMRGIPFVSVPTTLLAMVDAAIGGKTGLNTSAGKNLIGAFYHPHKILIDTDFLSTLPEKEWFNGLSEMVKHGIIADKEYFHSLNRHTLFKSEHSLGKAIRRSIEIKSTIVTDDERESNRRMILNFGHTVGHAIEQASRYKVAHGLAIAWGMAIEVQIACQMGLCSTATCHAIIEKLMHFGLLTPLSLTWKKILAPMAMDKKNRAGRIRCALPREIGKMATENGSFGMTVPLALIQSTIKDSV